MSATFILLQLAGYVALLLGHAHSPPDRAGVWRHLRQFLYRSRAAGRHFSPAWARLCSEQHCDGTLSTSFIAAGFMTLVPALAVTLGANVGTTLIVVLASTSRPSRRCSFSSVWSRSTVAERRAPVSAGSESVSVSAPHRGDHRAGREVSSAARSVLHRLGDPIIDIMLAAHPWAAYSSVAAVLLVISLAEHQIVTPVAALALVLGANLGNVIPQYFAAGTNAEARQLALGNLIVRGIGCLAAVPMLPWLVQAMSAVEASPVRQVANFHTFFNLALALVFIGLLDPLARLCAKLGKRSRPAPLHRSAHHQVASSCPRRCDARGAAHGRHRAVDAANVHRCVAER